MEDEINSCKSGDDEVSPSRDSGVGWGGQGLAYVLTLPIFMSFLFPGSSWHGVSRIIPGAAIPDSS